MKACPGARRGPGKENHVSINSAVWVAGAWGFHFPRMEHSLPTSRCLKSHLFLSKFPSLGPTRSGQTNSLRAMGRKTSGLFSARAPKIAITVAAPSNKALITTWLPFTAAKNNHTASATGSGPSSGEYSAAIRRSIPSHFFGRSSVRLNRRNGVHPGGVFLL